MKKAEALKKIVREKYADIANNSKSGDKSCCGEDICCSDEFAGFAEEYDGLKGYDENADLGLGCGLPTEFARIKSGDTVLDLGSGAGNDCFVAREVTGASGKVIGVDMTAEMIGRARSNADRLGYNNVEFRMGEIEELPVGSNTIDVVVSNCVLNLIPDKGKAFEETFRVLKPGGHFSISDVVYTGNMPPALKMKAELYAGCVSGAILQNEYVDIIKSKGFVNITIQKRKKIQLSDELLENYLSAEELKLYRNDEFGIYSITVYAEKAKNTNASLEFAD